MQEKIRFQKNVPSDIDVLLERYSSEGTSNRVRSSISRTFELIELFPEMYAVVYDDIRLVKTKDYPGPDSVSDRQRNPHGAFDLLLRRTGRWVKKICTEAGRHVNGTHFRGSSLAF